MTHLKIAIVAALLSCSFKPVGRYPTGKGSNWVEIVSFD